MRKGPILALTLSLVVLAGGAAMGATPPPPPAPPPSPASDPSELDPKIDAAKLERAQARRDLRRIERRLDELEEEFTQARSDVQLATRDLVTVYQGRRTLEAQLATARIEFDHRVAATYRAGTALSIELFLGMRSFADFASVQEFTARTIGVGQEDIDRLAQGRAGLDAATTSLELRQAELETAQARIDRLAVSVAAQVEAARSVAAAAGLEVDRLEARQQKLLAEQAALDRWLADLERAGGIGPGCGAGPVHDLIVEAFSPLGQDQVDEALRIATRESGCNPNAWNPTVVPPYGNAAGVFQILYPGIWEAWTERCGYVGESPFDANANVEVAACVVADQGWGPWEL